MTMPGSRTVAYEYDDAGALVSLTDWNSQESTFTYDATGRMETMQRPNGLDTLLGYDTAGRLTLVEHAVGTDMIARYAYDLDENGNRDEVAVTGSAVTNDTESYVYDDLDRLTNVSYLSGGSVAYEYDENSNRTQVASGGLTTIYAYDAADQLTSLSGAVSQTYGYDAAGNRVTAGTDEYAWDWNNPLREAEVDSVTSSYTYAGDDLRTSKTVGSTTTSYLWDRAGGLPRVLADGPSTYLWAPDQLVEEVTTANAESYPAADALGSVRARTDDGGSVTGTADWDAFGSARAATGALGAFGWAGEQQDGETGLTYLRSRYYAPGTSRFLSRDTVSPDAAGTNGYAPCAHAADNPATHTDPTSPAIDTAELVHHRIDTA